ncbi:MAG: LuxR C-terminal-related transcriptional regulator [Steroidobacteraceae bacterium]
MRRKPDPAAEMAGVDAGVLGAFLLDLYRLAREAPLADFQRRVLDRLCEALPFSGAWWGMTRTDRELHSSFPYHMPAGYADYWYRVRQHDPLADIVLAEPGITVHLSHRQMSADPVFARFCAEYGTRQSLCTLLKNPTLNLATFLSLYRNRDAPRFTAAERRLKQLVMPHLWAAWTSNWITQLASDEAHGFSSRVAVAIVDQKGLLHAAEPRFSAMIQLEWPEWQGPELPAALLESMRTGAPVNGRHGIMRVRPVSGLFLVEARERSPLDRLTPRELAIAQRFGSGKSYKEIAAALPVSPATVRAHLRAIYSKLEISDKTELASLLSQHSEPRRGPAIN